MVKMLKYFLKEHEDQIQVNLNLLLVKNIVD